MSAEQRTAWRLRDISAMINSSYPPGLDPETIDWRRIHKASVEANEALEALAGSLGENPRKGVVNTRQDVVDELLDTAIAALAAVEHLTGHEGSSLRLLTMHTARVHARLAGHVR